MSIRYVYTLSNPVTSEIRYIGQTFSPKRRYYAHNNSKGLHTYTHAWIKSLHNKGLKAHLEILEIGDESNIDDLETYWIEQFKAWGFRLTNLQSGGLALKRHSEETKEKIRQSLLGKKHTDSRKLNQSLALKGRIFTDEHKVNLRKAREAKINTTNN